MSSITGPPTAEDWESRRPLITRLYRDEKKPLHKVMARVNHSGFRASPKMYRTRIHQWGLDKKLKEHEARAIIQMHARRSGKATRMRLRDLPVDIEKAYSHFKRKGTTIDDVLGSEAASLPEMICETPAVSPAPMPQDLIPIVPAASIIPQSRNRMMMAGPQGLGTPRAFRVAEMLFVDTRECLISSIHLENGHNSTRRRALEYDTPFSLFLAVGQLYRHHQEVHDWVAKDNRKIWGLILQDGPCETVLLMIGWIAMLLGRKQQQQQQKSTALVMCKQLYSAATYLNSNGDPIVSALGRLFSKIGLLLLNDVPPDYLLTMMHVSLDSLKTLLGPAHALTVFATVTLSRVMCLLHGPEGLLSPLETLRSSLREQDGWGMEQSLLIDTEMVALEVRCGRYQKAQELLNEIERASSRETFANILNAILRSKLDEPGVQVVSLRELTFCFKVLRLWNEIRKQEI